MKHHGDITKISGHEIDPVDCIIGGSPCQDLSIAGNRAGLDGERSGLFMEQIRIVKEMRDADRKRGRPADLLRPRWMVWENVTGAFSSKRGADFAAVIEEILKICCPEAEGVVHVSVPANGWPRYGCVIDADGRYSLSYKVHDAQYWGVPQRRKRISLVVDFNGIFAPEVLFDEYSGAEPGREVPTEREGLPRDIEPSREARKSPAREVENSLGTADRGDGNSYTLQIRGGGVKEEEKGL